MITLAFDSTAKIASVAIASGTDVLASALINNGVTQSELLLPIAEGLLKSLKMNFSDVELLGASAGPGSFTGVRIGVALIKGLAFGRDIPCAEISALEALAYNLNGLDGIIVPVMDAKRNQVYTAIFKSGELRPIRLMPDSAISLTELSELLKKYEDTPIYLVGDGYDIAYSYLGECGIKLCSTPSALKLQNAASVAMLSQLDMYDGNALHDTQIKPIYLRLPQAERERLEREKKENK